MKKRTRIVLVILSAVVVMAAAGIWGWAQKNSSRMLLSTLYFMEHTLKDPEYLLYDVDIMDVCRSYANGDIRLTGKAGVSGMKQAKSSMYVNVDAKRSFAQRRMCANLDLRLLWMDMGELDFYGEDETVYMEAPLLGEDIGNAFPTGQDLFLKMPDLTSDLDREWFLDHMTDIVQLTNEMTIQETGETLEDEDGEISEGFLVTIPKGTGGFLWELLGMDVPDYDVECVIYLTANNHLRRIEIDLSHVMKGASILVDGENIGTAYFYYKLPESERVEMKMVRNPKTSHRVDTWISYYANTGKQYDMTAAVTWKDIEDGVSLKVEDLVVSCDEDMLAKGFFKGEIQKQEELPDLFGEKAEELYQLEVLDWKTVRDDTEGFIDRILAKSSMSVFLEEE